MRRLILAGRLIFGAWMLANGISHFFIPLFAEPTGHEPLAIQLMAALVHSRLFDVVMAIQLGAGALILAGVFVPIALCVMMPLCICAVYWSAILDHQPLGALSALAAFALNGLLMLAYLDYYRGVLQPRALTLGEHEGSGTHYESLFADPRGRASRDSFIRALLPLLAAAALYFFLVKGRNGEWVLVTLLYPAAVLHIRRLHDMGHTAWPLLVPGVLLATAISLHMGGLYPQLHPAVTWAACLVSVAFLAWGSAGQGQTEANRFGEPAAA